MSPWLHAPGHRQFTVPPFHRPIVTPCRHVNRRPCHRATIPPCHLPHRPIVPPAIPSHRGTCHTVPPSHLPHRPTEPPSTPSHRPTVPPATIMPQPCRRDIWCATVAACRRRTDTSPLKHRHTFVHPRTWHTSPRT